RILIDRGLNQIDCFKVYIFSILSGFERMKFSYSLVAIAKRSHPFPSRTRKLSSSAPMVVRVRPCESRTSPGRCRASAESGGFFVFFSCTEGIRVTQYMQSKARIRRTKKIKESRERDSQWAMPMRIERAPMTPRFAGHRDS